MTQIKIVTDSTAEIPVSTVARLGINVIPVELCLDGKTWRDGVDITAIEFLKRVEASSSLPTTIPPSIEAFRQTYERLSGETDQILSIHMSSKLGAAAKNAQAASSSFLGQSSIVVLDSEMASAGLGMLVCAAAEAAIAGKPMHEIVRLLRGMIPHVYVVFFIESLEYLERSNLIDKSQAVLGNLLSLKPMLIVEDGEILPLEKVRTRDKAVARLHEFISEYTRFDQIIISHGLNDQESSVLLERIAETFPDNSVSLRTYGPALATHIGANALGVIVYEGM